MFLYSPHVLTPHDMQYVQEDAIRTWVTSRPGLVPKQSLPQRPYAALCPSLRPPPSVVAPSTRACESRVKFWHSSPVLTQLAHLFGIFWHSNPVITQMYTVYGRSGVGLHMLLDLCSCLTGSFQHSSHICVKFFGIQVPKLHKCALAMAVSV